jgi:hypothetical protein
LGLSTFVPGLWLTSLLFFAVNIWILGVIVDDLGSYSGSSIDGIKGARMEKTGSLHSTHATEKDNDTGKEAPRAGRITQRQRRELRSYMNEMEGLMGERVQELE